MKLKAFFIILKELSVAKICLRPDSAHLKHYSIPDQCSFVVPLKTL